MIDQIIDHRPQICWFDPDLIREEGKAVGMGGISVYVILLTYAPNPCPSQSTLADMLGCSVPTVRKYLQALQDHGWIMIEAVFDTETNSQEANRYHLLGKGGVKNFSGGGKNSFYESTTTNSERTIFQIWEEESRTIVSPMIRDTLIVWENDFGKEWVRDAIKEAVDTVGVGHFGVKYIQTILNRWEKEGRESSRPDPIPDWVDPAYRGVRKQY